MHAKLNIKGQEEDIKMGLDINPKVIPWQFETDGWNINYNTKGKTTFASCFSKSFSCQSHRNYLNSKSQEMSV